MNRNQMSWVPIYNQVNLSVIQRFPSVIFIDTLSVSRMHHNTKPHITDADMKVTTGLKLRCKGPSLALNVRHFFLGSFSILIQPVAQWCSGNESGEVVSPILYTTSNPGSFMCSPLSARKRLVYTPPCTWRQKDCSGRQLSRFRRFTERIIKEIL